MAATVATGTGTGTGTILSTAEQVTELADSAACQAKSTAAASASHVGHSCAYARKSTNPTGVFWGCACDVSALQTQLQARYCPPPGTPASVAAPDPGKALRPSEAIRAAGKGKALALVMRGADDTFFRLPVTFKTMTTTTRFHDDERGYHTAKAFVVTTPAFVRCTRYLHFEANLGDLAGGGESATHASGAGVVMRLAAVAHVPCPVPATTDLDTEAECKGVKDACASDEGDEACAGLRKVLTLAANARLTYNLYLDSDIASSS